MRSQVARFAMGVLSILGLGLIAAISLSMYFILPVEPSTYQIFQTAEVRTVGGNGWQFFWLGLIGFGATIGMIVSSVYTASRIAEIHRDTINQRYR